ncbi:pneumococcal-type histidine triad protein, partial [Streptococcus sp. DD11]|uniref:pneumococcal-type histidine triad protein n=1 Tax=Streptococcus sp. DD11 TaxID=1777879 RepID=UPI0013E3E5CE
MKKNYMIGAAAVLVLGLCFYGWGRWQSVSQTQSNRVSYIGGRTGSSQAAPKELTPEQISEQEGIAAEQIVVKISDQGYVTSHGDHYHYYNGKVPFDAIISEELIMRRPDYKLQQEHIVNEVQDGYIIKVDGSYFLYLKDAKHTTNVRSVDEIARQKQLHHVKEDGGGSQASGNRAGRTQDFS